MRLGESGWEEFVLFLDYDVVITLGDLLNYHDWFLGRPWAVASAGSGSCAYRAGRVDVLVSCYLGPWTRPDTDGLDERYAGSLL